MFGRVKKQNTPDINASIDLGWVDEFIEKVKPWIFVREEDRLLIKRPNSAQKLNLMGVRVLKSLLGGMSIRELLQKVGQDKKADLANFFYAVKAHLEGTLDPNQFHPAVERIPFKMEFSELPVLSEIALTYQCNLACNFCYAGCNCTKQVNSTGEMNKEQIMEILRRIFEQAKVPSVSFTGGEPTLVKELPELICYAKKLGFRVNLISNGTQIDEEKARCLADSGLDSAQISIEAVTEALHEKIVQRKGVFKKSVNSVKLLRENGIHTHTNTTLSQMNREDALNLPSFVKDELGSDKFSMNLMIPCGSAAVNDELVIPYSGAGEIVKNILDRSKKEKVEFMWYSPVPMCFFNTVSHGLGNKGCSACDGLLSISPKGEVLPCSSYGEPVGNLLEQDFDTIWQSDRARLFRKKELAPGVCRSCSNFSICNGCCPLYWQHVGEEELTQRGGVSEHC